MLMRLRSLRLLQSYSSNVCIFQSRKLSDSTEITKQGKESAENELKIAGLAKALGKFRQLEKSDNVPVDTSDAEQKSFLHLLRHSEFVQMGDPRGKVVIGKIFQVVNTDLYIDFGGKFHCVCRKPKRNSELYVRGAEVKLRLNETELSARFLGATEDLTLLEACGSIIDVVKTPVNSIPVGKQ